MLIAHEVEDGGKVDPVPPDVQPLLDVQNLQFSQLAAKLLFRLLVGGLAPVASLA